MTPCLTCLPLPADYSQAFSDVLILGGWVFEKWFVLRQHFLERRPLSQILGGTPRIPTGFWKFLETVSVSTPPAHRDRMSMNNSTAQEHKTKPSFPFSFILDTSFSGGDA